MLRQINARVESFIESFKRKRHDSAPVRLPAVSAIAILFNSYRGVDCIDLRTANGSLAEVTQPLEREADANAMNKTGWTPIAFAARTGNIEPVKLLIKAGADKSAAASIKDNFRTEELIKQAPIAKL